MVNKRNSFGFTAHTNYGVCNLPNAYEILQILRFLSVHGCTDFAGKNNRF